MKNILFCFLLLNLQFVRSQPLEWHEGVVVLASNEIVLGKFSLEPLHDILFYEEGERRKIFPAHKIQSLYVYDKKENINRRFISVKGDDLVRNHYRLFEIVVQGEVTVLRRQKTPGKRLSDALDFIYYVRYGNDFYPLRQFSKRIYPLLVRSMSAGLENFVRENRLLPYREANSIQIIEFYNRRFKLDEVLAKQ